MSLSGITHHSHLFTRLKIYHHIYFNVNIVTCIVVSIVSIVLSNVSNVHAVL